MTRIVSVVGIALAMVIGFVALSTQMHDDYTVRALVIDAVAHIKQQATQRLACKQSASVNRIPAAAATSETPDTQIDTSKLSPPSTQNQEDTTDLPSIFTSLDYNKTGVSEITATAVFKDVTGESGKLRIKAGRKMIVHCLCHDSAVECDQIQSDINKKYVPGHSNS